MTAHNQRAYERVTTLLPFRIRRIPPGERAGLACRLVTGGIVLDGGQPPPVEDERLQQWLSMVNAKLDYLIRLSPSPQQEVSYVEIEPLNISGGGMSLVTREAFDPGDVLEIKIVVQAFPPKVLYLYGDIVRIEAVTEEPGSHIAAVQFIGMSKGVLDEILKFDFRKHRQKMKA